MTLDKRKQLRINFGEDVILNNNLRVRALNLSEQGIYLHTGRHFAPEAVIDVSLPLGEETLKLKARVQHSQRGIGMGLMFLGLTPEQEASLKKYIEGRSGDLSDARDRVLIVDDNEAIRMMYKSKLILDGLCVFEAGDEKTALELLEKEKINLLILNPYPAKGDGFRLLTAIAENPDWQSIVLLILAPRSTPEDIKKAKEAGVAEFLLRMSTSPARLSEKAKSHLYKR